MSETAGAARTCAACGSEADPGARWCEACGADLGAPALDVPADEPVAAQGVPAPCRECGGVVDADGYCTTCGAKAPLERDHLVESPQPWVAAVSDRGVRHHRNEDAAAVWADPVPGSRAVLVVCDGVSSSQDSDVASLAAVRAARDVLVSSHAQGLGTADGLVAAVGARLTAAVDAASEAVTASTSPEHGDDPPSCTFVAAVVEGGQVVAGVVGDSRAYWLPDDGPAVALTVDDSWAAEQVAAGVPQAQAEAAPQAHAITRWLGVDAPDHTPRLTSHALDRAGWVLVCSDGLWNYCSPADDLAALVRTTSTTTTTITTADDHDATAGTDPLPLAEALVAWANAQGGHDNITVALARVSG